MTYSEFFGHRIVNYQYYQAEQICIGSGAVESAIKQIDRRAKISGAQWKKENVPQVRALRSKSEVRSQKSKKWIHANVFIYG